jgi:hypothetical protein
LVEALFRAVLLDALRFLAAEDRLALLARGPPERRAEVRFEVLFFRADLEPDFLRDDFLVVAIRALQVTRDIPLQPHR